jgi:hypothetical protein
VQQKLVQLQKSLYSASFKEARLLDTLSTPEIASYCEAFEAGLPKLSEHCDAEAFSTAIAAANLVLYGDFHTLRESQLGFVRLLRNYCSAYPERQIVIAVEMFAASQQKLIDDFLAGKLTNEAFRDATNYDRQWGFPWERYCAVLDFAKMHGIKVKGINVPNRRGIKKTLRERDEFAAAVLINAAKEHPEAQIFCMIGEHHLGDSHLPAELTLIFNQNLMNLRCVRVLNNAERYYFAKDAAHALNETCYRKLGDDFFCIMNTAPWIKWQSLHNWEESKRECIDDTSDSDYQYYNEEGIDFDSQIVGYLKYLKEFLTLEIEDHELEDFHLFVSPGSDTLSEIKENYSLIDDDLSFIQDCLWQQEGCVLNYPAMIIDKDVALNKMAYAVGELLFTQLAKKHLGVWMIRSLGRDVSWLLLRAIAGTIASKVFNPHWQPERERDDVSPTVRGFNAEKFLCDTMGIGFESVLVFVKTSLRNENHHSRLTAVKIFGERIGETIYKQVIVNKMPANLFQKIFLAKFK